MYNFRVPETTSSYGPTAGGAFGGGGGVGGLGGGGGRGGDGGGAGAHESVPPFKL